MLAFLPALGWMLLIFFLSSRQRFPQPPGFPIDFAAIGAHLFLYGVLAALLMVPLRWSLGSGSRAALLAVIFAIAYGISDEIHQSFVPGRDASVFDVVIDGLGATFVAVALSVLSGRPGRLPSR